MSPKTGWEAITTTAFCTVLLVTSLGLRSSSEDASCRLHLDMHSTSFYIQHLLKDKQRTICRTEFDQRAHPYLCHLLKARMCSAALGISSPRYVMIS